MNRRAFLSSVASVLVAEPIVHRVYSFIWSPPVVYTGLDLATGPDMTVVAQHDGHGKIVDVFTLADIERAVEILRAHNKRPYEGFYIFPSEYDLRRLVSDE